MISNQILQSTIEGLKSIARVELCVMDTDGKAVAVTADEMEKCGRPAAEFARSPADSQEIQGYQYFKIFDEQQLEYILIAGGIGRFMLHIGVPYERVILRGGQRVVEESPPLDSGSNYYDYHGPFVRGTELLEGSFYLELFGSGEGG